MPQSTRIAVAAQIATGFWDAPHMPELIRMALGNDPWRINTLHLECMAEGNARSITLVYCIAANIGRSLADMNCG